MDLISKLALTMHISAHNKWNDFPNIYQTFTHVLVIGVISLVITLLRMCNRVFLNRGRFKESIDISFEKFSLTLSTT